MAGEPPWLLEARKHLGVAEIPGKDENPVIQRWLASLKYGWNSESVPWCGTFLAYVMKQCGIQPPLTAYRAQAWLGVQGGAAWGAVLPTAVVGCVVVFWRKGGGHVGLVVGQDQAGNLMVLGGNQGDAVSIRPFSRDRVLGYRYPPGFPVGVGNNLPFIGSDGMVSTQEA